MSTELRTAIVMVAACTTCIFAAYWLLCRMVETGSYINDVWVAYHDQQAFAGFFVAVDADAYELLAVARDYNRLRPKMRRYPEHNWAVVHLPGVPCESMDYLLLAEDDQTADLPPSTEGSVGAAEKQD